MLIGVKNTVKKTADKTEMKHISSSHHKTQYVVTGYVQYIKTQREDNRNETHFIFRGFMEKEIQ